MNHRREGIPFWHFVTKDLLKYFPSSKLWLINFFNITFIEDCILFFLEVLNNDIIILQPGQYNTIQYNILYLTKVK